MTFVEAFLNILFLYFIFIFVLNLFTIVQARKTAQKSEEKPGEIKPTIKEEIEMVTDSFCGSNIPKSKAYILAIENKRYYFCSWACREKFIAANVSDL